MIPSKHLYLTIAATTAALLTGLPAANAAATIEAASGNGAGLVLSMSLLGTTVATATLPGNVTLLGNQSPVATGTAVTGSTTNGTPYTASNRVANLNLTESDCIDWAGNTRPFAADQFKSASLDSAQRKYSFVG